MKRLLILFLFGLCSLGLRAETIDELILEALGGNLELKQSRASLQGGALSVKRFKTRLWPRLDLSSRLTFAGGGRAIDFPVGDMLNPILNSVNRLYLYNGLEAPFSRMFENIAVPFVRSREQETRLRLSLPLVNTTLWHGLAIEKRQHLSEHDRHRLLLRDLVYQVRCGAIDHRQAWALAASVKAALSAMTEHLLRVESLARHGVATDDLVEQARSELATLRQKEIEVQRAVEMSRRQVNLLLNRELETPLDVDEPAPLVPDERLEEAQLRRRVLEDREELKLLDGLRQIRHQEVALHRDRSLPSLALAVDYGIQGEAYRLGGEHDYWMASLVLEWPLFNGGESRMARRQAHLSEGAVELRREELQAILLLQLSDVILMVKSRRAEIEAGASAQHSARLALEIVEKRFAQGMALQLEVLAAHARWLDADERLIRARHEAYKAEALLERVAALYECPMEEEKNETE